MIAKWGASRGAAEPLGSSQLHIWSQAPST